MNLNFQMDEEVPTGKKTGGGGGGQVGDISRNNVWKCDVMSPCPVISSTKK